MFFNYLHRYGFSLLNTTNLTVKGRGLVVAPTDDLYFYDDTVYYVGTADYAWYKLSKNVLSLYFTVPNLVPAATALRLCNLIYF